MHDLLYILMMFEVSIRSRNAG